MNRVELLNGLQQLDKPAFEKFVRDFGGEFQNPERVVRDFVDHPEWERRLCQLLDLPTEDEEMVQAAVAAAWSAKWSAVAAAIATVIALISVGVTIYGVFK